MMKMKKFEILTFVINKCRRHFNVFFWLKIYGYLCFIFLCRAKCQLIIITNIFEDACTFESMKFMNTRN